MFSQNYSMFDMLGFLEYFTGDKLKVLRELRTRVQQI